MQESPFLQSSESLHFTPTSHPVLQQTGSVDAGALERAGAGAEPPPAQTPPVQFAPCRQSR